MAKICGDFGGISNLTLNLNKTVVMPLFPLPNLSEAKDILIQTIPSWSEAQFSYCAKYLGFILGPEAGDKSWQEAVTKFQKRAQSWSEQHIGLHCTAVSYNIFALSVLTYLAQLIAPPKYILDAEQEALRKIAPGPTVG